MKKYTINTPGSVPQPQYALTRYNTSVLLSFYDRYSFWIGYWSRRMYDFAASKDARADAGKIDKRLRQERAAVWHVLLLRGEWLLDRPNYELRGMRHYENLHKGVEAR
jgi:hypothetical protein